MALLAKIVYKITLSNDDISSLSFISFTSIIKEQKRFPLSHLHMRLYVCAENDLQFIAIYFSCLRSAHEEFLLSHLIKVSFR